MKNYITAILFVFVTLSISQSAFAGNKTYQPVSIGANYFFGSFGSARNSADSVQFIYCADYSTFAACAAKDAAGNYRYCSTTNPVHIATVQGMVNSSLVRAEFSTGGACTRINQINGSYLEPKVR